MKKLLWIGLAFFVVLVGCNLVSRDFYRAEGDFPEDGKGMLVLILDSSEVSKTLDPADPITGDPTILQIASYHIWGDNTDGDSFDHDPAVVSGGVYTNNTLEPGLWTIYVNTWNGHATPVQIGHGQITDVTILPDDYVTDTVPILPRTDSGVLDLTIDWDVGAVPNATVSALLDGGAISFTVNNGDPYNATYNNASIAGGYHTFSFELFADSGATKVTGLSESIRIISDYSTIHEWTINDLGEIVLTIDEDYRNPITIDLPKQATSIDATTNSISATAALVAGIPDPLPDSYDFVWYIDGVQEVSHTSLPSNTTEDTLTISSGIVLADDNHNLSVVVTAHFSDGFDIISSTTTPFTVQ